MEGLASPPLQAVPHPRPHPWGLVRSGTGQVLPDTCSKMRFHLQSQPSPPPASSTHIFKAWSQGLFPKLGVGHLCQALRMFLPLVLDTFHSHVLYFHTCLPRFGVNSLRVGPGPNPRRHPPVPRVPAGRQHMADDRFVELNAKLWPRCQRACSFISGAKITPDFTRKRQYSSR